MESLLFREKKKKCDRSIIAILSYILVYLGLVTSKKEISCQCFASIVTSFFEGRKKQVAMVKRWEDILLLDTIYTRKPRMVTNGVLLYSFDFLRFLNLLEVSYYLITPDSSNLNRSNSNKL